MISPLPRFSRPPLLRFALLLTIGLGWAQARPVDNDPAPGWWQDATFYEVFVRSFADASSGPLAGDGVGDLQGLIDHLDYLNDGRGAASKSLGVDALWLMPVQPSPSYHGYDVTDYFGVNPAYGDVALMKQLVGEAHRRGIRVVVDLVLNHCSVAHPLFQSAVTATAPDHASARGMFRFADVPENITGPYGERVWHPIGHEFYYGVFSSEMPDWNFRDPAVTEHHRKAAAFWLREIGVDGFRLDAVRYFYESGATLQDAAETRAWLRDFTAYCHSIKPGAFVVGENTGDSTEVGQYIRGGSLDSAFEFDLARATVEAIRLKSARLLGRTVDSLLRDYAGRSPWSTFLSNHDQDRIASQLGGDATEERFAAELLFTLPGVPFVYYGEEIGMTGTKPDPEIRTPFAWSDEQPNAGFTSPNVAPWHPVTGNPSVFNVASERRDPGSLLLLYHQLIRMRKVSPALRHGTPITLRSSDRRVYAEARRSDTDAVLVLANFGTQSVPGPAITLETPPFPAQWAGREELGRGELASVPANQVKEWRPFTALAPRTVYVVRWAAP